MTAPIQGLNMFPNGRGHLALNNDAAMMIQGQMPNEPVEDPEFEAWKAKQGAHADDPEFEAWKKAKVVGPKPKQSGWDTAAGAIGTAYQGLTGGFGNKLTAATKTLLPQAMGGTKGFDYPTALKETTGQLDQFRGAHPNTAAALEAVGSVPLIMATGGAGEAPQAAGALRRAAQLVKTGAQFGGAAGAASANPATLADVPGDVTKGAAKGAAIGAAGGAVIGGAQLGAKAVGKGRELLSVYNKVKDAPTLGRQAVGGANALKELDTQNYGQAEAEGAGRDAPSSVQLVLNTPKIKKFADMVRGSEAYAAGMDDATLARETHALMSDHQKDILKSLKTTPSAEGRMEARDIQTLKQKLKSALGSANVIPDKTVIDPGRPRLEGPERSQFSIPEVQPMHETIPGEKLPDRTVIDPGRPRVEGPLRTAREPAGETFAQQGARERLQRTQGLADAKRAGPIEGTQVERALNKPTITTPPELPVPGFVLAEKQPVHRVIPGAQLPDQTVVNPGRPRLEGPATPAFTVPEVQPSHKTIPGKTEPALMPSFPTAVDQSRGARKLLGVGTEAADRAKTIITDRSLPGVKQASLSPEATQQWIGTLSPDEAQKALQSMLARSKESLKYRNPMHTMTGAASNLVRPASELNRIVPFIKQLEQQAGTAPAAKTPYDIQKLLRSMVVGNAVNTP